MGARCTPSQLQALMLPAGLFLLTLAAGAKEVLPAPNSAPRAAYAGPQEGQNAPLSLDAFLRQVEANYPKLVGAELERQSAAAKRLEKQGAFDPVFTLSSGQFAYNNGADKRKEYTLNEALVEAQMPFGLKVGVGSRWNQGSVKAPFSNTGQGGEHFLSFKFPLLRGLGINDKAALLRQAELAEPLADAAFQQTRLELLLKAAQDYWDWAAANEKVRIARDLLQLAQTRAQAVEQRAQRGDLPGIDAVEANQEVQRRQGSLTKAERDLMKAALKVGLYLWTDSGPTNTLPDVARTPTMSAQGAPQLLPEDAIARGRAQALQQRPELRAIALSRDITRVDLRLANNQRLPALDLVYSPALDTGAHSVGDTFKAGVVLSVPLRQRGADGLIQQARLKIAKFDQEEQLARQRVAVEVEDAVSAVNTTQARYLAAQQEYELARRLEQGERDRFAAGDSTLFLVNQRERATAEAAVKLIDVQAEYEQARAYFRAVTVQL